MLSLVGRNIYLIGEIRLPLKKKLPLFFPYYANNHFLEVFSLISKSGNHKSDHN